MLMKKSLGIYTRRACAKKRKIYFYDATHVKPNSHGLGKNATSKDYARRFNIKRISTIESRRDVASATTVSNKAANSIKIKCTPRQHMLNAFP